MCCKCSDKLKSSYDFIQQIHNVNKKYSQLLSSCKDPLQDMDCLAEATIDLPLEIKLEEELLEPPFTTDLTSKVESHKETKTENEGTYLTQLEDFLLFIYLFTVLYKSWKSVRLYSKNFS